MPWMIDLVDSMTSVIIDISLISNFELRIPGASLHEWIAMTQLASDDPAKRTCR